MKESIRDILNQPLLVHFKPGPGGKKFRYVEGKDVIARLNLAFGHKWSSRVILTERVENQIIVLVELEYDGVVHQGYGGSEIALYRDGVRAGKPVDISNSYKGAFTNALKKAAEQFGVGLISEDNATLPTSSPATDISKTETYKAQPISSSVTIKTGSTVNDIDSNGISKETLEKQVRDMLSGKTQMTDQVKTIMNSITGDVHAAPAPAPAKETLAGSFKNVGYDPEKSRVPEAKMPFSQSGNGDEMINDIQLHAIEGLAKMKKLEPSELISRALPDSNKTDYTKLTKDEAKAVIFTLNNLEKK